MNPFETSERMITISDELTKKSEALSKAVSPERRRLIEEDIDILEVEFFSIKHMLENIKLTNI
ncbi:hypothetical protein [Proteiniclasticum ruminis]|uniref:Uncharacterized protein n=1 Tax=Proteiniclasticum ruminis TaxID=398199 RepID=A0A1I5F5T6_9CLOT|nr:hypothetical protein [Proteiniclasticum ruminis]SFO19102.1 hypothetical protein SAMN04488695_1322 [Proteiniclasticum ruminis]